MRLSPLSLMGGSYADNSLTWSAQRTLNWLPETAEVEGTRTPIKFADIPGLRAVVDLGTNAPIRGLWNVEGKLFAVSSTSLFEISTSFGATNRGSIPGVTRVSMAHNKQGGATAANELVIANGISGYVYNTSTNALVQITDEAFQGATTVDYVDGYITFTDPQGRFWGHSALNQATNFSSIDRYDAESAPDPIISHIVSHREVMVFGTRTIEFFRNTGAATGTFQRVDGTELEVGICSPFARSRVDNSVCWVSDGLEVFRLEGHSPQRISDRPIEQILATVNPANIFCFPWEDQGHKVFYITAPEAFTIGFDFASGMWHERQTFDLPRWRANALAAWNGYWIVGDYTNGLLYVLDWDTHHENGLQLIRERASGYTHGGQNKVLAPYVELLFDTGTEGPDPLTITGDVPSGEVGQVVSAAYTVAGGVQPYGNVTVVSGTFPPGLTLNPDGTYSGTYTTAGNYSWTVGLTDADGTTVTVADGAAVTQNAVYIASANNSGRIYVSDKGLIWSLANFVTAPSVSGNTIARGIWDFGDVLLISVGNSPYGLFLSTDAGLNWTQAVGIPSTVTIQAIAKVGSRLVAQHPSPATVYVSDNNGANWSTRATASSAGSAYNIVSRSGTLQLSDSSGTVQTSVDQAQSWTLQSPYAATSLRDMTVTPTTFVGTSRTNNDLIRVSTDGTKNTVTAVGWPGRNVSTNVTAIWYDHQIGRVLGALSNGSSIYSDDAGYTWLAGGAIGGTPNNATTQTGWADNGISFVLTTGAPNKLFISQNGGVTWSEAFNLAGASVVAITSKGWAA